MLRVIRPIATCALVLCTGAACSGEMAQRPHIAGQERDMPLAVNPVHYFEIPVTDMDRAIRFYETVFGFAFRRQRIDGYDMALFPRADGMAGASGALAKGDVYRPSHNGAILYFDVADIDDVLQQAEAAGAKILYAKKDIGDAGYVAEIEDSEGNRIALHSLKK